MARTGTTLREGPRESKAPIILDSWAVLAWLQGEEPANKIVKRALKDADKGQRLVEMCVVNLGEVYTAILRERGLQLAEEIRVSLRQAPISNVPVREPLTWRAARLKAAYSLSYADTFAAALALEREATLYTGDPEFVPLEKGEGLKIRWLNRES